MKPKCETSELLSRATVIVNRYSSIFSVSSYSTQTKRHDDYQNVLRGVHEKFRNHREDIDSEIALLT